MQRQKAEFQEVLWVCSGQPGSRVKSFAVSSNGMVGVTVLFDSTISVWDLKTMQVRHMTPQIGLYLYPHIYTSADSLTPAPGHCTGASQCPVPASIMGSCSLGTCCME